jgi:hypothetical protein
VPHSRPIFVCVKLLKHLAITGRCNEDMTSHYLRFAFSPCFVHISSRLLLRAVMDSNSKLCKCRCLMSSQSLGRIIRLKSLVWRSVSHFRELSLLWDWARHTTSAVASSYRRSESCQTIQGTVDHRQIEDCKCSSILHERDPGPTDCFLRISVVLKGVMSNEELKSSAQVWGGNSETSPSREPSPPPQHIPPS